MTNKQLRKITYEELPVDRLKTHEVLRMEYHLLVDNVLEKIINWTSRMIEKYGNNKADFPGRKRRGVQVFNRDPVLNFRRAGGGHGEGH